DASKPSTGETSGSVQRGDWRERVDRPATPPASSSDQQATPAERAPSQDWRGRAIGRRGGEGSRDSGSTSSSERGGAEVPRRIIDSIGGGRIYSGDRSSAPRDSAPPRESSAPRS